jgi:hypothetical protein
MWKMTERERIKTEIADSILLTLQLEGKTETLYPTEDEKRLAMTLADDALRVVEAPLDSTQEVYSRICTCQQSGYPENSPHSNHPHKKGCPQWTGLYD